MCHPQGGNIVQPQFPVIGSWKLSDQATFTNFIRDPVLPGGQKGQMPRFTEKRIPEKQMKVNPTIRSSQFFCDRFQIDYLFSPPG